MKKERGEVMKRSSGHKTYYCHAESFLEKIFHSQAEEVYFRWDFLEEAASALGNAGERYCCLL